jgi:hypothetical protein
MIGPEPLAGTVGSFEPAKLALGERLGDLGPELRFAGRGSGRLLDLRAPVLTVTDPCIWHGCGTNLSRRQSATMVGAPTDQARVCLAAPPRAFTTLPASSTRASYDGRHLMTVPEPSAWEAQGLRS